MQFFKTVAFVAAAAGFASAADITVLVGDGGNLAFNPPQVTAQQGDNIIFEFRAKNHSVTQSSFAQPCTFLSTAAGPGVDSGFQPVPTDTMSFPQWSITIDNATAPLWFYCAQKTPADHCAAGMVFAINPTAAKTFDAFQAAAKAGGTAASSGASSGSSPATIPAPSSPSTTGAATLSSGFSTSVATATAATGTTTAPNGALGVRVDSRAATLLAAFGLLAGLIL